MAHPLSYYVSVRPNHPAAPILKELEERFGANFDRLSAEDLHQLLAICAVWSHLHLCVTNQSDYSKEFGYISGLLKKLRAIDRSLLFAMVPFLYEQLSSRGGVR